MVTNEKISATLREIADLLSLKNESTFKVAAYRHAADAIDNLNQSLNDIYKKDGIEGLDEIEGIGESIAEKIAEILETGKLEYYQKLVSSFPPFAEDLLAIPGVGPKLAQQIMHHLKIKKIDDLEKALKSPVAKKNFSPKTITNILQGLAFLRTSKARLHYFEAKKIADEIIARLQKDPDVKSAEAAGSLRRGKETIGDIDLVVASENPAQTIDRILKEPFVKRELLKGDTKGSFIHSSGTRVDLEVMPPKYFPALLHHFTGSKEHNVHLRTIAEKQGDTISEYGIKHGQKVITFPDEAALYKHFKMDYIPPEIREDEGEIEAALEHHLPSLIEFKDIRGDLHVHSDWSDGDASIEDMVRAAIKMGYHYLGICDHSAGLGIAHGLDERRIKQRQKEIETARQKFPSFRILAGLEINIRPDGSLDMSDAVLKDMDIITASIHSSFNQDEKTATDRLIRAMANPYIHIIGHPTGSYLTKRPAMNLNFPKLFQAAAKYNIALEINSSPFRLSIKEPLIRQAQDAGVKFAINTDAHNPAHLSDISFGVMLARRSYLEKKSVINTLSFEALSWRLKDNK